MELWIVRDKNGNLWIYTSRPYKSILIWRTEEACWTKNKLDPNLFPEVKWEDDEPTKVELKIVKK